MQQHQQKDFNIEIASECIHLLVSACIYWIVRFYCNIYTQFTPPLCYSYAQAISRQRGWQLPVFRQHGGWLLLHEADESCPRTGQEAASAANDHPAIHPDNGTHSADCCPLEQYNDLQAGSNGYRSAGSFIFDAFKGIIFQNCSLFW